MAIAPKQQQLFCIPQRYDFSSKSQPILGRGNVPLCCFVYRKGTIFQANHNCCFRVTALSVVVLYTAKVRFFKQITTTLRNGLAKRVLFCIPQRYDFSSKSQQLNLGIVIDESCFVYRKGTIFQANHNWFINHPFIRSLFCIPQRYDFSSKSQHLIHYSIRKDVVLYTAKVRFFKQITT